jgi:iron complex transport system substrate-binding protein
LVHFRDTSHVALYGANSTVEYALNKLGISLALPTPITAWGQVDKPVSELAKIGSGVLIYIKPFNDEKALFSSQLWRHLPFVRQHRFTAIEPCWTFGSALSIEHIAQATTQALLTLEN